MSYKALLISPITSSFAGVQNIGAPGLGVHRIAHYVRHVLTSHQIPESIKIDVLDVDLTPEKLESIDFSQYQVVGISVLNDVLINTIRFINSHSFGNAILVLGGAEATLNYQEIFDRCSRVNAICQGEGEGPFLHLLTEGLTPFPGLIIRTLAKPTSNQDLWNYYSAMDFTAMGYDVYWQRTVDLYKGEKIPVRRDIRLVTSNFCPRGCNFCSVTMTHKRACGTKAIPAYLSASQIDVLLERISRTMPQIKAIYFCEDDALLNHDRTEELIEKVFPKYKFEYLIQTFSNRLTESLVKRLGKAGVVHITMGIESPIARIRKWMGKPQDSQKIEDIIQWCKSAGIAPYYLIILFAPEITYDELIEAVRTLRRWVDAGVTVSVEPMLRAYKGAPLYDSAYEMDYEITKISDTEQMRVPRTIYPKDEAVVSIMKIFQREWPSYLERNGKDHKYKGATGKLILEYMEGIL